MVHDAYRRGVLALAAGGLLKTYAQPSSPAAHITWPASAKLDYDVFGIASAWHYRAQAQLLWQHDGRRYTLSLTLKVFILGKRQWSSAGLMGATGLQPMRMSDSFKKTLGASLDRQAQQVRFDDAQRPPRPLRANAQDQMSVILQWGVLTAATPFALTKGQSWPVQVVTSRAADDWRVTLLAQETLSIMDTPRETRHWMAQSVEPGSSKLEFWSDASMGGLPARIRISQDSGDEIDMRLKAMTLTAS